MKYRRDIDGLRCFAVVSVLLYHLNPQWLPGGFTGVDIFFVISGYLITGLLRNDMENGQFSLARFYSRRVRRIFPALFTVLFCTFVFAVVALEPNAYQRFMHEFRFAVLQVSNFIFAREVDYFDPGNELSLLLHTWSLGVEEQFYLLWPFLIFVGFRLLSARGWVLLLGLVLGSFLLSDHLSTESPQQAFYLLHSRAWELGVGGLLTFIGGGSGKKRMSTHLLGATGLFCIMLGFFRIDQYMPFPGRNALLPVVGAALLIYAGGQGRSVVSLLFENRLSVFIGKISYSVYLWHWPLIIAYTTTTGREMSLFAALLLAGATFVLAALSYRFVEQPFRRRTHTRPVPIVGGTVGLLKCGAALLLIFCLLFSYRLEQNSRSTTLEIDIRGVESPTDFSKEYLRVYWASDGTGFNNDNSHILDYSDFEAGEGSFHFVCELPPLHAMDSIRLDPLRMEGIVDLVRVRVTSGFWGWTREFQDFARFAEEGVALSNDLEFSRAGQALRMRSLSDDPYFILFPAVPRFYESVFLFAGLVVIAGLLFMVRHCSRHGKYHIAEVMAGGVLVVVFVMVSYRGQFSNRSGWRFVERESPEYWKAAKARVDLKAIDSKDGGQVVLWADSHVENYAESVYEWASRDGLNLVLRYRPACPPVVLNRADFSSLEEVAFTNYAACFSANEEILERIEQDNMLEYVFLAMRYEFYLQHPSMMFRAALEQQVPYSRGEFFERSFEYTIGRLRQAGKKVVLLGQIPVLKETPDVCIKRDQTLLTSILKRKPTCDIDDDFSDTRLEAGRAMFERAASGDGLIYFFRPEKYVTTIFGEGGALKYIDNNHLNGYGGHFLVPYLLEELDHFSSSR